MCSRTTLYAKIQTNKIRTHAKQKQKTKPYRYLWPWIEQCTGCCEHVETRGPVWPWWWRCLWTGSRSASLPGLSTQRTWGAHMTITHLTYATLRMGCAFEVSQNSRISKCLSVDLCTYYRDNPLRPIWCMFKNTMLTAHELPLAAFEPATFWFPDQTFYL